MDSKSIPLFAGLLVLVVIGVFLVGRGILGPPEGEAPGATAPAPVAAAPEPEDLHPKLEAGRAAIRAGNLEEARELLNEVPEDDVSYLLAQNDLGILNQRMGDNDAALKAFETILEHQPENPFALYHTCHSQVLADRLDAAELTCLRALEIDPRNALARFELGLIRVAQGKLVLGVDAYLRAVQQHNDETAIRQAALQLDAWSRSRPEMPEPHYAMAVLARVLLSRETEREELERYLELAPDGLAAGQAREKLEELTEMGY